MTGKRVSWEGLKVGRFYYRKDILLDTVENSPCDTMPGHGNCQGIREQLMFEKLEGKDGPG